MPAPALAILLFYSCWLGVTLHSGHGTKDFIFIGRHFVEQSHASTIIKLDPHYHYPPGSSGYDGQFAYYIALDPARARYYLDTRDRNSAGPDYRYTRILYPMLARFLALQRAEWIPSTLLLINLLALAGGTLAVAAWLRLRRLSPWYAMVYGLYPGLFVALQRDLNEALAYGLVAWAVYLYDLGGTWRALASGFVFGLAALTRETTLVFPALYGLALGSTAARQRDRPPAPRVRVLDVATFLGLSIGPFVLYKLFLLAWLGTIGRSGGVYPQPLPFRGIAEYWPWGANGVEQVVGVIIPGMICGCMCLWELLRGIRRVEVWLLLAQVLLFVVFLNAKSYVEYFASGRVAAGVVLAALYCLPVFDELRKGRWWFWVCSMLWLGLLPAFLPFPRRDVRLTDVPIVLALVGAVALMTRLTRPSAPTSPPLGEYASTGIENSKPPRGHEVTGR